MFGLRRPEPFVYISEIFDTFMFIQIFFHKIYKEINLSFQHTIIIIAYLIVDMNRIFIKFKDRN